MDSFYEVRFPVSKERAGDVEDFFLKSGALGSHELLYEEGVTHNLSYENTILFFYFAKTFPIRAFLPMACHVLNVEDNEVDIREIGEEDYLLSMKKHFHSHQVIEGLILRPPWEEVDPLVATNERIITINPSFAFGTGLHETTQLMLEYIRDEIRKGDMVIDMGCGSGILSIAAVLYGAEFVVGIDIDSLAVESSKENWSLNQKEEWKQSHCEFHCGDFLTDVSQYLTNTFIANILPEVFIKNEAILHGYLLKYPKWALSGVVNERANEFNKWLSNLHGIPEFRWKKGNDWSIFYRI